MQTRVRWRLSWPVKVLFLTALLLNNAQYSSGAPQRGIPLDSTFSHPQGKQNPLLQSGSQFRVVQDIDDGHESVEVVSFRRPTSATFPQTPNVLQGKPGFREASHTGVPLSATNSGPTSAIFPPAPSGGRNEFRVASKTPFGIPLSATNSGPADTSRVASTGQFGTSKSGPAFVVRAGSLEDQDEFEDNRARSHFSIQSPSRSGIQRNEQHFHIITDDDADDDISIERMSLGRRFHPLGVPTRSDPLPKSTVSSPLTPAVISNPFILKSEVATFDDDSDEDDDNFVVLSPLVKSQQHKVHGERLSLSDDFLNQYNFVDVKGSVNWGYKTDDQYQEHKVHQDGAMEGKFGWTAPEGSRVNIQYIADERGYRVISSSGVYTKDDDEVLRQKKLHFAEHDKAKAHLNNNRNNQGSAGVGIPLPPPSRTPQDRVSESGSGFVVIPDNDDDFPLITGNRGVGSVNSGNTGIPLPKPTGGSSDQGFGIPLPQTPGNAEFGPSLGEGFGVPLPQPSSGSTGADQDFGVPLPDPSIPLSSSNQGLDASSNDPGFGIPLADPSSPSSGSTTTGFDTDFGIPLSSSSGLPSPSDQGFGIPIPDPSISSSGSSTGSETDFGISLSASPGLTSSSDQGFGIPLPEPSVPSSPNAGFGTTSSDNGFGISSPDFSPPSGPANQDFGIPLLDSSAGQKGSEGNLVDSEFGISSPAAPIPPRESDQGFGIPLGEPSAPSFSDQGFGISPIDQTVPGSANDKGPENFGVPLPSPSDIPGTPSQGTVGLGPCDNAKLHPSLLPPECFEEPGFGGPSGSEFPVAPPTGNDGFGIPLGGISSSGQDLSNADGTFGIPIPDNSGIGLNQVQGSNSVSNQGNFFVGEQAPDFGLGPISSQDNSLPPGFSNQPPGGLPNNNFDTSFGIPLSSSSGSSSVSGGAQNDQSQFFVIPEDQPFITGVAPSGKVTSQNVQNEGGSSSHTIQETGSSLTFSNNDPNFDPSSFGIPLSPQPSPNLLFTNSESSGGVSLFDAQPKISNSDLLQGPPVEELGPLSAGGKNIPKELDFPNQNLGKSIKDSKSTDKKAHDSFIVVVNSDLFEQA